MMRINHLPFADLEYSDTSQDWAVAAGKLAPLVTDPETIFSQLIKDALESTFGSMPYLGRARYQGFEGYGLNYDGSDDGARLRAKAYLEDIIRSLAPFVRPKSEFVTVSFADGVNAFDARIECVLADVESTTYDHVLTWNGTTKRASIV